MLVAGEFLVNGLLRWYLIDLMTFIRLIRHSCCVLFTGGLFVVFGCDFRVILFLLCCLDYCIWFTHLFCLFILGVCDVLCD